MITNFDFFAFYSIKISAQMLHIFHHKARVQCGRLIVEHYYNSSTIQHGRWSYSKLEIRRYGEYVEYIYCECGFQCVLINPPPSAQAKLIRTVRYNSRINIRKFCNKYAKFIRNTHWSSYIWP